jgi:hypothetical protein
MWVMGDLAVAEEKEWFIQSVHEPGLGTRGTGGVLGCWVLHNCCSQAHFLLLKRFGFLSTMSQ